MNKLFHMKQFLTRMISLGRQLTCHIRAARAERKADEALRSAENERVAKERRQKQEKREAMLRLEHITIRANVFATTRTTARRPERGWN
jgi:hypothetical protein